MSRERTCQGTYSSLTAASGPDDLGGEQGSVLNSSSSAVSSGDIVSPKWGLAWASPSKINSRERSRCSARLDRIEHLDLSGRSKRRYPPIETDLMRPRSASIEARSPNRYSSGNVNRARVPTRNAGDRDRDCVPGISLIKIADPRRLSSVSTRPADCPAPSYNSSTDQSEVKAPGDVVREIRLAVPTATSASTEKGETIPDALSSIAIMATAIADRKAHWEALRHWERRKEKRSERIHEVRDDAKHTRAKVSDESLTWAYAYVTAALSRSRHRVGQCMVYPSSRASNPSDRTYNKIGEVAAGATGIFPRSLPRSLYKWSVISGRVGPPWPRRGRPHPQVAATTPDNIGHPGRGHSIRFPLPRAPRPADKTALPCTRAMISANHLRTGEIDPLRKKYPHTPHRGERSLGSQARTINFRGGPPEDNEDLETAQRDLRETKKDEREKEDSALNPRKAARGIRNDRKRKGVKSVNASVKGLKTSVCPFRFSARTSSPLRRGGPELPEIYERVQPARDLRGNLKIEIYIRAVAPTRAPTTRNVYAESGASMTNSARVSWLVIRAPPPGDLWSSGSVNCHQDAPSGIYLRVRPPFARGTTPRRFTATLSRYAKISFSENYTNKRQRAFAGFHPSLVPLYVAPRAVV
ncbi:hypothetical protein DBV15_10001 [Temnothorax longispinosus]|uniref:Uncharacterized protein n=1 Tax=Temnothorax longispinosus TaxID=300112 RepID=A0A4S2KUN0_9HYME|nr:hypothetical protein DBV15_10001 [Temnothorax longispinosus]